MKAPTNGRFATGWGKAAAAGTGFVDVARREPPRRGRSRGQRFESPWLHWDTTLASVGLIFGRLTTTVARIVTTSPAVRRQGSVF